MLLCEIVIGRKCAFTRNEGLKGKSSLNETKHPVQNMLLSKFHTC